MYDIFKNLPRNVVFTCSHLSLSPSEEVWKNLEKFGKKKNTNLRND